MLKLSLSIFLVCLSACASTTSRGTVTGAITLQPNACNSSAMPTQTPAGESAAGFWAFNFTTCQWDYCVDRIVQK